MLHNNTELFEQVVLRTAEYMKVEPGIIEKDYFVTLLLRKISKNIPSVVFRGGTSLSKCYKIINRFSEDIDLTIQYNQKPSVSGRREMKNNILASIETLDLKLENADEIMSRRDFNKYVVNYPSIFNMHGLKQHLQVETMIKIKSYPTVEMEASSLIYEFLVKEGYKNLVVAQEMLPYTLKVQSAERTFIDKIFALADYYLSGRISEQSRHIYDLFKLLSIVDLDDELHGLYESVRIERMSHKVCISAQDKIDMKEVLDEIIRKQVYKNDYNNTTKLLIFENINYEEAIVVLEKVKSFL